MISFPAGRNKRVAPPQGRRKGHGVIAGLAARRPAALLKRGTLNKAAFNQVPGGVAHTKAGNEESRCLTTTLTQCKHLMDYLITFVVVNYNSESSLKKNKPKLRFWGTKGHVSIRGVGLRGLQLKGGASVSENETEDKTICSAPGRPVQEAGGAEVVPAAPQRPERHHSQETLQAPTKVRSLLQLGLQSINTSNAYYFLLYTQT